MAMNDSKNRKSGAQERFEEADNAGRFAGNDPDARAAKEQAIEEIRQDTGSSREERNKDNNQSDREARRDPGQSKDYKGDSQNVNDDTGRPLNEEELEKARNKANEGREDK